MTNPAPLTDAQKRAFNLLFNDDIAPAMMNARIDGTEYPVLCATYRTDDETFFRPIARLLTDDEVSLIEVPEGAEEVVQP